jgi:predicted deacylase
MLHPDAAVLAVQRRMAAAFGLPVIWGTDPGLQGRSLSVARDALVPAIYAEYDGGGRCDAAGVQAYVEGCLDVVAELGMIDPRAPSPRSAPLVVEDPRPGSGHMQIHHPSPCEGFFEPVVSLGQRVAEGDVLGTVSDLLGRRVEPIRAAHAGLVIVLRSFARINKGDSAGVVLALDATRES